MTDLIFYDASTPPAHPPAVDGVAFYIGGDTPHVWIVAEIDAAPARYRLPTWVRSDPAGHSGSADAAAAAEQLAAIGAPRGCVVALDTETAVDPVYVSAFFVRLMRAGYVLLDYGSQSSLFANHVPHGGYYWGADWTGTEHVDQGDEGTQYQSGPDYDLSAFKPGLPFWDTHVSRETDDWTGAIMKQLPTLRSGSTGAHVGLVQFLCGQHIHGVAIDNVFGSVTAAAVVKVQQAHGLDPDGVVGPKTWPVLLGVA